MIACKVTLVIINVWGLAALLATIFECSPPQVWGYKGQCIDQWALYLANMIWNVTTDCALILLPFFLMRNVQVSAQKKWVVIGLFGCRIIVPAFTIASAVAMYDYWHASTDPTWDAVQGALWTQAILNLSIITACIPCIKRFLADLSSGLMAVNISEPLELTMKGISSSSANRDPTSTRTGGGFLRSKIFPSRGNQQMNGQHGTVNDNMEKKHYPHAPTFAPAKQSTNKVCVERSDSMKGLTDGVIMQTIDYEVNFEQSKENAMWDGSSGSHQLESRPSHGSSPPHSRTEKEQ